MISYKMFVSLKCFTVLQVTQQRYACVGTTRGITISTKDPNGRFLIIAMAFHGNHTVWFLSLPITNHERTLTAARQEFCSAELHAIYISRTEQKTMAIRVQLSRL